MGSKTRLLYHIILTTKYRKSVLAGIEQQVYADFREIEKHSSFEILAMGIEHGNHIHMIITSPPQFSVSGLVSRLKDIAWSICEILNLNIYPHSTGEQEKALARRILLRYNRESLERENFALREIAKRRAWKVIHPAGIKTPPGSH